MGDVTNRILEGGTGRGLLHPRAVPDHQLDVSYLMCICIYYIHIMQLHVQLHPNKV